MITQTASKTSIFFQPSAFWTLRRDNKAERGSAERRKLLFLCVGLYAPPLLMVRGALDPRLHLLIWLNTGSMTAMSPGRPFTSLRGVDESSGLWERETHFLCRTISFMPSPPSSCGLFLKRRNARCSEHTQTHQQRSQ